MSSSLQPVGGGTWFASENALPPFFCMASINTTNSNKNGLKKAYLFYLLRYLITRPYIPCFWHSIWSVLCLIILLFKHSQDHFRFCKFFWYVHISFCYFGAILTIYISEISAPTGHSGYDFDILSILLEIFRFFCHFLLFKKRELSLIQTLQIVLKILPVLLSFSSGSSFFFTSLC